MDQAEAAAFRDRLMPLIVPVIIGALLVLVVLALLATRLPDAVRRAVRPGALAALGVVPATYAAGKVPAARDGTPTFLLAVAVVAACLGALAWLVERRRPGLGAIVVLGSIGALYVVDVLLGARLQLNTVFGYSVAVAGRFAGLGNLAFALFAATALLLSALLVDRLGERGVRPALAVLVIALLVEGLPMLGADVGGVLAMVPAFGIAGMILAGRRPGWRHLVGLGAAGGVVVLAVRVPRRACAPTAARPTWPVWPSTSSTGAGARSPTPSSVGSRPASAPRSSERGRWWRWPWGWRRPTPRSWGPAGGRGCSRAARATAPRSPRSRVSACSQGSAS